MMSNRKLGNDFEEQFCQTLSDNGFWVHRMAQTQTGQPADVIAAKNGRAYLIDCKVCSGHGFALSRIEQNQSTAMELWKQCGNGDGWFAFYSILEEQIYFISHSTITRLARVASFVSNITMQQSGFTLKGWLLNK